MTAASSWSDIADSAAEGYSYPVRKACRVAEETLSELRAESPSEPGKGPQEETVEQWIIYGHRFSQHHTPHLAATTTGTFRGETMTLEEALKRDILRRHFPGGLLHIRNAPFPIKRK